MRGKAAPSGTRPAGADEGSVAKSAVLSAAVKRANKELTRRRSRGRQRAIAERAMALKADRTPAPRPQSRTANEGMSPIQRHTAPSGALDAEGHRPVLERSRMPR